MAAAVRFPQAQPCLRHGTWDELLTETEVHDLLGFPVGLKAALDSESEGTQHLEVEGEGAFDIADREIDVVDSSYGTSFDSC